MLYLFYIFAYRLTKTLQHISIFCLPRLLASNNKAISWYPSHCKHDSPLLVSTLCRASKNSNEKASFLIWQRSIISKNKSGNFSICIAYGKLIDCGCNRVRDLKPRSHTKLIKINEKKIFSSISASLTSSQ